MISYYLLLKKLYQGGQHDAKLAEDFAVLSD
jgi:hypothetical protein